jgi:hypothetical protein
MPRLQPAGALGRLFSSVFPKKLKVQVRSEEHADGRIALTPVYLLDGQEGQKPYRHASRMAFGMPPAPAKSFSLLYLLYPFN